MSEAKILEHMAMMSQLREQGVRAQPTRLARRDLAKQLGIKAPGNQVPMNEREAWTLPEAADVFGLDYHALLMDANRGVLATFRPRTPRGTRGWRRVNRAAMEDYLSGLEAER
jgi:hypothetical protein